MSQKGANPNTKRSIILMVLVAINHKISTGTKSNAHQSKTNWVADCHGKGDNKKGYRLQITAPRCRILHQ